MYYLRQLFITADNQINNSARDPNIGSGIKDEVREGNTDFSPIEYPSGSGRGFQRYT